MLPVYNPYIWGGAPLLGGWNAGALYPFTFLFAALPGAGAWTLNVLAVYWVAALGMYAFLRTMRLRPVPEPRSARRRSRSRAPWTSTSRISALWPA